MLNRRFYNAKQISSILCIATAQPDKYTTQLSASHFASLCVYCCPHPPWILFLALCTAAAACEVHHKSKLFSFSITLKFKLYNLLQKHVMNYVNFIEENKNT